MNTFYQVAIGAVPALIAMIIYIVVKRKKLHKNFAGIVKAFFGVAALLAVVISGAVLGYNSEGSSGASLVDSNYIQMVYNLSQGADEESLSLARKMLDEQYESISYCDDLVLCNARLSALEGKYTQSYYLYQKVGNKKPIAQELDRIKEIYDSITEGGAAADFSIDEIQTAINAAISSQDEESAKVSDIIAHSEALFNSDDRSPSQARELLEQIDEIRTDSPQMMEMDKLRICRLKNRIIVGDYSKIALDMDDDATLDELIVASELQLAGEIDDNDYTPEYGEDYVNQRKEISQYLEKLAANKSITEAEKAKINMTLENYKMLDEYKSLGHNITSLCTIANDENSSDRSKAYFELSKIEFALENEDLSQDYFENSLNNIQSCVDNDFSQPVNKISSVIQDNCDPEEMKKTQDYIIQANDAVSDIITPYDVVRGAASDKKKSTKHSNNKKTDGDSNQQENNDESYVSYYKDFVSMKKASLNISKVNTDEFDKVSASFNIDADYAYSAEDIKKVLKVYDCGIEIEDYTITKKNYSRINVVLCCDLSGSMDSAMDNLKRSVSDFISTSDDIERIGIVAFDGDVIQDCTYAVGTSKSTLSRGVEDFSARGGTNMFSGATASIDMIKDDKDCVNIVFLLSDGQDNSPKSYDEIIEQIGASANDKNITIYSFGLGNDVDADYLSQFSDVTDGEYLYISDSSTIDTFYSTLRKQIKNQYEITYNAVDTMTMDSRELTMKINTDALCTDTKTYNLKQQGGVLDTSGVTVSGFDTRLVLDQTKNTQIKLLGTGFSKEDNISIILNGDSKYIVDKIEFADEKSYKVTLPDNMAIGVYNVTVNIRGKVKVLPKELTIADKNQEKETRFGDYVFTSFVKSTDDANNITTLSGYVTLNDWLYFNGTVTLDGNLKKDSSISLSTDDISIVTFGEKSEGVAKKYAAENRRVTVPAFSDLRIFDDSTEDYTDDDANYNASRVPLALPVTLPGMFYMSLPSAALYPDRFVIDFTKITTQLPFQDQLISALQEANQEDAWSFDVESNITLSKDKLGFKFDFEIGGKGYDDGSKNSGVLKKVRLGNALKLDIKEAGAKIHFDSTDGTFGFEIEIGSIPALWNIEGFSIELGFKYYDDEETKGIKIDKLILGVDREFTTKIYGINVTFSDFKLGIEDVNYDNFFKTTLKGQFDADIMKIKDDWKLMKKFFGDISFFGLNDATISVCLGDVNLKAETDLYLLEKNIAKAEIEIGKMDYTNSLLGMNQESAVGIRAAVKNLGVNIDTKNLDLSAACGAEISFVTRFFGLNMNGGFTCDAQLWVFQKTSDLKGEMAIGFMPFGNYDIEKAAFIIKADGTAGSKKSGMLLYCALDGEHSIEIGELS